MIAILNCISVKRLPLCIVKSVHRKKERGDSVTTVSRRLVQLLLGQYVVTSSERNKHHFVDCNCFRWLL